LCSSLHSVLGVWPLDDIGPHQKQMSGLSRCGQWYRTHHLKYYSLCSISSVWGEIIPLHIVLVFMYEELVAKVEGASVIVI